MASLLQDTLVEIRNGKQSTLDPTLHVSESAPGIQETGLPDWESDDGPQRFIAFVQQALQHSPGFQIEKPQNLAGILHCLNFIFAHAFQCLALTAQSSKLAFDRHRGHLRARLLPAAEPQLA